MINTLVNDLSKKKEYEENIKKQKETTLLFKNIQDEGFELFKKKMQIMVIHLKILELLEF